MLDKQREATGVGKKYDLRTEAAGPTLYDPLSSCIVLKVILLFNQFG